MLQAYFTRGIFIVLAILCGFFVIEFLYYRHKEKKMDKAMQKRGFIRVRVGSKIDSSTELEGYVSKSSYRHFSKEYGYFVDYLFIDCQGREKLLDGSKISYISHRRRDG